MLLAAPIDSGQLLLLMLKKNPQSEGQEPSVPEPGQDLCPAQLVTGLQYCLSFPTILPQPQR